LSENAHVQGVRSVFQPPSRLALERKSSFLDRHYLLQTFFYIILCLANPERSETFCAAGSWTGNPGVIVAQAAAKLMNVDVNMGD
jgi:hypothetical protein